MSDTPRIDAVRAEHRGDTEGLCRALIAHANALERELATSRIERDRLQREMKRLRERIQNSCEGLKRLEELLSQ